jgi:hypothetical protein
MSLDHAAIAKGCPQSEIENADHLCRAEIERFRKALARGERVHLVCHEDVLVFRKPDPAAQSVGVTAAARRRAAA